MKEKYGEMGQLISKLYSIIHLIAVLKKKLAANTKIPYHANIGSICHSNNGSNTKIPYHANIGSICHSNNGSRSIPAVQLQLHYNQGQLLLPEKTATTTQTLYTCTLIERAVNQYPYNINI